MSLKEWVPVQMAIIYGMDAIVDHAQMFPMPPKKKISISTLYNTTTT